MLEFPKQIGEDEFVELELVDKVLLQFPSFNEISQITRPEEKRHCREKREQRWYEYDPKSHFILRLAIWGGIHLTPVQCKISLSAGFTISDSPFPVNHIQKRNPFTTFFLDFPNEVV